METGQPKLADTADDLGINNIMTTPTKELCDQIAASAVPSGVNVQQLFAVSMIDYRGPVGDYASQLIRVQLGDATSAFAFLAGICMGRAALGDTPPMTDVEFWYRFIENLQAPEKP